jgi:hypothetical protein
MEKYRRNEITKNIFYDILNYSIKAGSGQIPNPFKNKTNIKKPSLY